MKTEENVRYTKPIIFDPDNTYRSGIENLSMTEKISLFEYLFPEVQSFYQSFKVAETKDEMMVEKIWLEIFDT